MTQKGPVDPPDSAGGLHNATKIQDAKTKNINWFVSYFLEHCHLVKKAAKGLLTTHVGQTC